MLAHATLDKLSALRLPALAEAFQRQLGNPEFTELSFEDRLGLLVDAEWLARENKRLARALLLETWAANSPRCAAPSSIRSAARRRSTR